MANFQQRIRRIWLVLIGLIIIFFAFQIISPSGSWTCRHDFSARGQNLFNRSCLGRPSPGERVAQAAGGPLLLLADPVYLSVFSPRPFSQAEVTIVYRPHLGSSTPIFEAGFLADKDLWRYRLSPVYNQWLENGFKDWSVITEGAHHLYQKEERFQSIAAFLDSWQTGGDICSRPNCLAVYNVDLKDFPPAISLPSLQNGDTPTVFPYALRGAHQFYFYLADKGLELSGKLLDRNNDSETDDADFLIFSGSTLVHSVSIKDDRRETELSGEDSDPQALRISRSDLKPGLYRLEFRAGDDLSLSDLTINSSYLSAINKIWPDGAATVRLVTDASYLQVKAIDPAVFQTIRFGQTEQELDEVYKQFEIKSRTVGVQSIELASGGILMENNGVFAPSADKLLNPDYRRLDRFAPLSDQLDLVFADYEPAERLEEGWLRSELTFASGDLYRENGNYNLILSVPGMRLDSGAGGLIEIKEISVRFSGKNIWDKARQLLNL